MADAVKVATIVLELIASLLSPHATPRQTAVAGAEWKPPCAAGEVYTLLQDTDGIREWGCTGVDPD